MNGVVKAQEDFKLAMASHQTDIIDNASLSATFSSYFYMLIS